MELPSTAKPIPNAIDHWADIDGSIWCLDKRNGHGNKLIKKSLHKIHGYKYCGVMYPKGVKSKRVHRLVAEAHLPNPHNYPYVGHKNNIKDDNRVENLYWTTPSQNTKKAYEDGLAYNTKSYNDSQSKPVAMYDTKTNTLLGQFGSCHEAARITSIPLSTICRQCKYKRPVRKPYYFRYIT